MESDPVSSPNETNTKREAIKVSLPQEDELQPEPTDDSTESTPSEAVEPTPADDLKETPDTPEPAVPSADHNEPSETPDTAESETAEAEEPMYQLGMNWFVLRVASNKETHVKNTLLRKIQIEALGHQVGRILVPTEKTKSMKGGKQRIQEKKLYPGYVFVEMKLEPDGRIPQDVFFLIKETTGVGDFVGATGRPAAMAPHEVEKMLHDSKKPEDTPQLQMDFVKGDFVKISEGAFENCEGTVDNVDADKGIVRVLVTIFGRQTPVEVEYWTLSRADE